MGLKVSINMRQFKQEMAAELELLQKATRPAAQAGALIDDLRALCPNVHPDIAPPGTPRPYIWNA